MKFSRRDLLKLGCLSIGSLMGASMIGCSSQPAATAPSDAAESHTEERTPVNDTASNNASTSNEAPAVDTASSANQTTTSTPAVVFFSCTGNTEAVAEKIAVATDGALMRIQAAEPYSPADLNYSTDCRANAEQNSGSVRPALALPLPDIAPYETIYLGYPLWWGKAPRIILTFLESNNLAGKTIIAFCTSGSSPISGSIPEIRQAASGATVLEGRRFSANSSQQEIDSWVNSL